MHATRQLPFALTCVLVAACGPSPEPVAPSPSTPAAPAEPTAPPAHAAEPPAAPLPQSMPLEEAAKKFVADSSAAISAKDGKKFTGLFTAGGVLGFPAEGGWEEVKMPELERAIGAWFTAFPDLELTHIRVIGKGKLAVAEWIVTGTHKGDFLGKPATNKKMGIRGASVVTFAPDGKAERGSFYFDMATVMSQLGLGPKGAPVRAVSATPSAQPELIIAKEGDGSSDALARDWLATAGRGDSKALGALASDDITVSNQYMPSDTKGKKALEKETADGAKAFVDQRIDIAVCVPAGPVTACEYTWRATWKGPAMGMKPTGKTGMVHSLEVIRTKDGKVSSTAAYANGPEFANSFGIGGDKPKATAPSSAPTATKKP